MPKSGNLVLVIDDGCGHGEQEMALVLCASNDGYGCKEEVTKGFVIIGHLWAENLVIV